MTLDGVVIYMRDLRRAGICGRGARDFWAARGWAWQDFLTNGIPAQTLWDTEDGYARRVVLKKLEPENG